MDNKTNNKKINKSNCNKKNPTNYLDLGLDKFSYADYIFLSSALSYAIAEELSNQDIDLLLIFISIVSSDLALIRTKRGILEQKNISQDQLLQNEDIVDVSSIESEDSTVNELSRNTKFRKKRLYKKKKKKRQLD